MAALFCAAMAISFDTKLLFIGALGGLDYLDIEYAKFDDDHASAGAFTIIDEIESLEIALKPGHPHLVILSIGRKSLHNGGPFDDILA